MNLPIIMFVQSKEESFDSNKQVISELIPIRFITSDGCTYVKDLSECKPVEFDVKNAFDDIYKNLSENCNYASRSNAYIKFTNKNLYKFREFCYTKGYQFFVEGVDDLLGGVSYEIGIMIINDYSMPISTLEEDQKYFELFKKLKNDFLEKLLG